MRRTARIAILVMSLAIVAVVVVVAVVLTRPPSTTLSIEQLRSGTNFMLGGVRFNQTGFVDHQNGPIVDGGYIVTFHITFADGTSENVEFPFDGYCPVGAVSQVSTTHRGPTVTFQHSCGENFIRATVLA